MWHVMNVSVTAAASCCFFLLAASPVVQSWSLADRLSGRVLPSQPQLENGDGPRSSSMWQLSATRSNSDSSSYSTQKSTKQYQQEMVDFIREPMKTTVGDAFSLGDGNTIDRDPELTNLVQCIVRAADGRKAADIVALRVHHVSTLTSVLVILSGNSRPQNQAIAAAITRDVAEQFDGFRPGGNGVPEGSAASGWMVLDYGSVMVHIMTPKSRLYYNVEGQWRAKGGKEMDIADWLVPNSVMAEQSTGEPSTGKALIEPDPEDPFWS